VYAPAFARTLPHFDRPVVALVHESAYPWTRREWQRNAVAAGHRAALRSVVGAADGIIVTSLPRECWLATRRWLAPRPRVRIPVCATLTAPAEPSGNGSGRIGVLGFGTDDARPDVVVGALSMLQARGLDAELVLLGAPGPDGERARSWAAVARTLDCGSRLSFTGVVAADELARELAAVDVVAFPQAAGAGANKTTLGAALAFAKPVVALDGRDTWEHAVREGAVLTSAPSPAALAARLEPLLADERRRHRQGAAGHAFYGREMDPAVCARRQLDFIANVAGNR
jgi:glycosyltransferase involved in cell wall biosynthesis